MISQYELNRLSRMEPWEIRQYYEYKQLNDLQLKIGVLLRAGHMSQEAHEEKMTFIIHNRRRLHQEAVRRMNERQVLRPSFVDDFETVLEKQSSDNWQQEGF